jgi:putative heme-binding domain-containing protein
LLALLILSLALQAPSRLFAQTAPMRPAADLNCTIAADDKLVHDAFAMTIDPHGWPVVSGPGYVRTLFDDNNDGIYDRSVDWLRVEQGAQGLWREGNDLYYVADHGLWKSTDNNADFRGDGRPERILQVPTGGEHDAHAIRRGPDGYWYLTNGNFSTTHMRSLMNDKDSPVSNPKMGLIWRISPDFKTRSVWASGLRNTYDFDFLPNGNIVTYDSDEEREMTFPAYRPSRVYAIAPGSDGGFVSTAWIDNDARLTMPVNLASLGRGSPTGVCVYQHDAIGDRYRNAIIVLDWTFGRVVAVFPQEKGAASPAVAPVSNFYGDSGGLCHWEVILEPSGSSGFAPTDVCVAPNGDLLVVTGGRGTAGTLYRLSRQKVQFHPVITPRIVIPEETEIEDAEPLRFDSEQNDAPEEKPNDLAAPQQESVSQASSIEQKHQPQPISLLTFRTGGSQGEFISADRTRVLQAILTASAPWEPWSKARWLPMVSPSAADDLIAVLSGELTVQCETEAPVDVGSLRMRAAQVLVYTQTLLPGKTFTTTNFTDDSSLAAMWYVLGRARINAQQSEIQSVYDQSLDAKTIAAAATTHTGWAKVLGGYLARGRWEAIGLRHWICSESASEPDMPVAADRSLQQIKAWAYSRQSSPAASPDFIGDLANAIYLSKESSGNRVNADAFDRLAKAIRAGNFKDNAVEIMMALGFIQGSLGDPRIVIDDSRNPDASSVLDGYRSQRSDAITPALRSGWAKYCLLVADKAKSQGEFGLEQEALRTVAMLRCDASDVLDKLLARIDTESHPTADINVLCTIAASSFRPSAQQSVLTASAYAHVSEKVFRRRLPTDNHWTLRQQQLLDALSKTDSSFMTNLLGTLKESQIQSTEWVNWLPLTQQRDASQLVARTLVATDPSQWNASQLQIAGRFVLPPDLASKIRTVAASTIDSPLRTPTDSTLATDHFSPTLLVEFLAKTPTTADYETFLLATAASDRLLIKHGWSGLRKLPIQDAPRELQAIALLMAANNNSSIEGIDISQVVSRLRNVAARTRTANVPGSQAAWPAWQSFLEPHLKSEQVKAAWAELLKPPAAWIELVKASQSITGDDNRGAALFQRGQCNQCHNSATSIGPSLSGVTRRFSYEDLFRAIYEPSRDISDRFRASKVMTNDGQVITGMITYDGDDEIAMVLADGTTKRIKTDDIDDRAEATVSMMPENLLQGWNPKQLADLHQYLKGL